MESNGSNILDVSQFEFNGDFEEQVHMLLSVVRMTKDEVERLIKLYNDVESALRSMWPTCTIMPFGSVVSGLGIKTSDVDIYTQIAENLYENERMCVRKAMHIFRRKANFRQLSMILSAKVPILKFFHTPTLRHCDINFKSPAGVWNSHLIGFLLHLDDRALPLTILIKYWAKVHQLTGTNLMPNYTLIMMVIFFLQQKGILPPVSTLQEHAQEFIVDGWNSAFDSCYQHKTSNNESLYQLITEFFNYYTNFNYTEYVISPYAGFAVPKHTFQSKDNILPIFHLYKQYVSNGNNNRQQLKLDSIMCVQDPFEHSRNCAVAVYPRLAHRLLTYFKLIAELNCNENEFLGKILSLEVQKEKKLPQMNNVPRPKPQQTQANNQKQVNNAVPNKNHQFKNKVTKRKTNYYDNRRDIIRKTVNNTFFHNPSPSGHHNF